MIYDPNKYAPGTTRYNSIAADYGTAGADYVYSQILTGREDALPDALGQLKYGADRNDSATSLFITQITTDPLAAPLESANNQIGNAIKNVVKNPWVLVAVVLVVFHLLGGFDYLKRKLAAA